MEQEWLSRTAVLLGQDALSHLSQARVAVLGLGGVGGAAAEALCRAGVGNLLLVDHDTIDITNLNRQLFATLDTIGMSKTQAALQRLHSITAQSVLTVAEQFYLPDHRDFLFDWNPQVVIDAIDTVTAKLDLVAECRRRGIPLFTCLGTGNRLDPSQLRIGDITQTANGCGCGLARVMRRELKRRGILHHPVLFSLEQPMNVVAGQEHGRHAPGSISFVPPAAGYLLASATVRLLLDNLGCSIV